ncbi:hypothetical protein K1719_007982 [Acacia pycnantha]|nr:hypothetical protein K1719_007982 [Acacia pycnantha]
MDSKPHVVLTPLHRFLLNSRGPQALDGLSDFHFETPDGLPPSDANATQNLPSLCESTAKNRLLPFTKLLVRLHESASNGLVPPVTCLISDVVMTFTVKAAEEIGLCIAIYSPINATSILGVWHGCTLLDKGIIPLKDASYPTDGYLDTKLSWLPGMRNIRLRDLPITLDPNDHILLNFRIKEREMVERVINELMEGEKGKEIRCKVLQWQKIAKEVTAFNGSSYINLENLIHQVLVKGKN